MYTGKLANRGHRDNGKSMRRRSENGGFGLASSDEEQRKASGVNTTVIFIRR